MNTIIPLKALTFLSLVTLPLFQAMIVEHQDMWHRLPKQNGFNLKLSGPVRVKWANNFSRPMFMWDSNAPNPDKLENYDVKIKTNNPPGEEVFGRVEKYNSDWCFASPIDGHQGVIKESHLVTEKTTVFGVELSVQHIMIR